MYSRKYLKNKARELFAKRKYNEIIELFSDAVLIKHNNNADLKQIKDTAYVLWGDECKSEKKYDEAIAAYKKVLATNTEPGYVSFLYDSLGRVYKKAGKMKTAIVMFNKAIKLDHFYAAPYNGLGDVYRILHKYDKATKAYNNAIKLDPHYDAPYDGLGSVHFELGKNIEAIQFYTKSISLYPEDETSFYNRALVFYKLEQYEKAAKDYRKYIALTKLEPDYFTSASYDGLGRIYYEEGQMDKGIKFYNKAIKLNPNISNSYFNRALAFQKSGNFHQAIVDYQKYITLSKDQPGNYIKDAQKEIRRIKRHLKKEGQ